MMGGALFHDEGANHIERKSKNDSCASIFFSVSAHHSRKTIQRAGEAAAICTGDWGVTRRESFIQR